MNKAITIVLVLGFLLQFWACDKMKKEIDCPVVYGSFMDPRDGNRYPTVSICDQIWIAENLSYKTAAVSILADYPIDDYGVLYSYEQAIRICPPGWHLSTDEEWQQLEAALGVSTSELIEFGWRGKGVGRHLKSTTGWRNKQNRSNSSGFRALAGGEYNSRGLENVGVQAHFWTSTSNSDSKAIERVLGSSRTTIKRSIDLRKKLKSCRCVLDSDMAN